MLSRLRLSLSRFEVAEMSMAPALLPGDYLVAMAGIAVRPGDVVVFEHPQRVGFWLVKRVARIDGLEAYVISDNATTTRADSRSFGSIPVDRLSRAVIRYWPPRRVLIFGSRISRG